MTNQTTRMVSRRNRPASRPGWPSFFQSVALILPLLLAACGGGSPSSPDGGSGPGLAAWTEGYIDSPFLTPDGSAMYFLHSPARPLQMVSGDRGLVQEVDALPGHQGVDSPRWWNTDLYMATKNPDGTWSRPTNLGSQINTTQLECCPWVDATQTVLIFTREDSTFANSRSYLALRSDPSQPWQAPVPLPDPVGDYGGTGYHDLHMAPSGNLYFWKLDPSGDGALYFAPVTGVSQWGAPTPLPAVLQSPADDSQPWVSADELTLYYNRRDSTGTTQLMMSRRTTVAEPWSAPVSKTLDGFADSVGALVWGEPSLSDAGSMLFVQFDTSVSGWKANLMLAPVNPGANVGPPAAILFSP